MNSFSLSKINLKNILLWLVLLGLSFLISFINAQAPPLIFLGVLGFLVITVFIFKYPIFGLLLIIFFLPFERIGAYEFGNATIRISQVLTIVTILSWLTHSIIKKKFDLAKNPTVLPLTLFIIVTILSLNNALNLERSVTVLLFLLFTIIFSYLVPNLIKNKETLNKVILALLISALLVSLFGIFQFIGDSLDLSPEITGLRELYTKNVLGFPRAQSTASEPLYFANYLLIPLGILLALFLSKSSKIKSSYLVILLIILGLALVLTVSRGGYLGMIALFLIVGIYYFKNIFTLRRILLLILVLVVIWFGFSRFLGIADTFNFEVFQEHTLNVFYGASFSERIETLESALSAFRDHPWVGIGIGGFGPYASVHPFLFPEDGWKIVNNEFVEVLAETGILGIVTFIIFLMVLIIRSLKAIKFSRDPHLRAILIGSLGALIGVWVQYQTFSTLYIMHIWFLVGLLVAAQNLSLLRSKSEK